MCLLRGIDWVFMCFVWIWEQTAIISLCSINWLVFITETECVYCAVRTRSLYFVWIWEQTAIISLYSINWLVFITETECVYCAVRTRSLCFVWIWEQTAIISLYSINGFYNWDGVFTARHGLNLINQPSLAEGREGIGWQPSEQQMLWLLRSYTHPSNQCNICHFSTCPCFSLSLFIL
jgi:hypothetical protein